MSIPGSMNVGPFTSKVLVKKKYLILYFLIIWLTLFTIQFEVWVFWNLFDEWLTFLLFLPLIFFILYVSAVLSSIIYAKIVLLGVNLFHKPREGTFLRDPSDRDYRYWSLRNTIKRWPIWLSHKFPFPFMDNICFKLFGVKTKFSNSLFEGWVDTEFIEFGDNVVVGQSSIIYSSLIIGNLLIIRKTIIEDNVHIGAHSIVMPGTKIGKNTILAANSATTISQVLENDWIYLGVPAEKYKKNLFYKDGLEEYLEAEVKDIEELRRRYEELYIIRHDESQSIVERLKQLKEIKEREKARLQAGIK